MTLPPLVPGSDEDGRKKFLALSAEYDNFRKRTRLEIAGAEDKGSARVLSAMAETIDDLLRMVQLDAATVTSASFIEAVDMLTRRLFRDLSDLGLEVLRPMGDVFDPTRHEAVAVEAAARREEDHLICRVHQPGLVFKGKVIRPARVVVRQWKSAGHVTIAGGKSTK